MKKRTEKPSKEKVDSVIEEESKVKTADDYQCSGNLQQDFTKLCKLMGVKEIPPIKLKQSTSTNRNVTESQITWSPERSPQTEMDNEDQNSIKEVKISGWKVDELMLQVLGRILPSLNNLQSLHMWRVVLTEATFTSLRNTLPLCSNLRKVVLDGNPLSEQSYHLLIGEDSMLTDLSLRNNQIGEEGARLICSALSTIHSSNKNLRTLNLAFNNIGDAGAFHIAQGLRFNRSLLCLSLSSNHIGDKGAAHLAEVLGPFALTHEEIVERRKLLIKGDQPGMVQPSLVSLADSHEQPQSVPSNSSLDFNKSGKNGNKNKDNPKKEEKTAQSQAAKKEEPKTAKKTLRGQTGKGGKEKNQLVSEQEGTCQIVEIPLLDPGIVHTGGKVIHPGNACLKSLNLSGNELTEQSLRMFLSSLESQRDGGLLRFSLNRNQFPSDCDTFLKIQEIMSLKDPLNKNSQVKDENSETKTTS